MRGLREFILRAIEEDAPFGDITSRTICGNKKVKAVIISKGNGIFCGEEVLKAFAEEFGFEIRGKRDGEEIKFGDEVASILGECYYVLVCERTILNIVSRLSGIATLTRKFVEIAKDVPIYDTRKTTPLMRYLEKYAVKVGGGYNHRMTLSEIVMIKDNHKKVAGGIKEAVDMVRKSLKHAYIEVEVENLEELREALECNVDWVLLDNMDIESLRKAMEMARGKVKIEISGGVNLENLEEIASLKPDRISVGAITKSAKPIDMSLEVVEVLET
ncbi:carboxylating nicotinate-nucleotide diphosphorylase [Candidatus Caldipriscus sp.]|nr:carboxylating nicotinate-nucleotide diphosphorylase [Candidatus Caldipriscus sp.]